MTGYNPEQENAIKENLAGALNGFNNQYIINPLESAVNAIIQYAHDEMYRYVFRKYMLSEMGMADIDTQEQIELYQNEINMNGVRNCQQACIDHNLEVTFSALNTGTALEINVHYPGYLSRKEAKGIGKMVEALNENKIKAPGIPGTFGAADTLAHVLVNAMVKLGGIGISFEKFRIIHKGYKNRIVFTVVDELLHRRLPINYTQNLNKPEWFKDVIFQAFDILGYSILVFDLSGHLLESKGPVTEKFKLDDPDRNLEEMLNPVFFENIFYSPFSIKMVGSINNYRVSLKDSDSKLEILYNMNGFLDQENRVITIWQEVNIQSSGRQLSEGSLFENTYMYSLITPYIPSNILVKARETARQGEKKLADEQKRLTIMFADLVNFTSNIEKLQFEQVMELLNLSMGTIVRTIERRGGYVDKFLGDGILCVFSSALDAVISAFEMQNNFAQLNEFRVLRDEPPIEIRVGMNTGDVILGSVGTTNRMDRTVLGDVVNTAARAEQYSKKNAILVTQTTLEDLGDAAVVDEEFKAKFKGKSEEQNLYYLRSIRFMHEDKERLLELPIIEEF